MFHILYLIYIKAEPRSRYMCYIFKKAKFCSSFQATTWAHKLATVLTLTDQLIRFNAYKIEK